MIKVLKESAGPLVAVRASGLMRPECYAEAADMVERAKHEYGYYDLYIEMNRFEGWTPEGLWERLKLHFEHGAALRRAAYVGRGIQPEATAFIWSTLNDSAEQQAFIDKRSALRWIRGESEDSSNN
jgi:hypothetical protein